MLNFFLKTTSSHSFLAFVITLISFSSHAEQSKVAIIIDDIGYRMSDNIALTLPGDITYSFLPHTPYGRKLALQANKKKHDVLIHIPMESTNGKKLGPGALTSDMDEQAYIRSLTESLAEIPFAIGINNHMGSYLTQLYQPMTWTMAFLKQNNLLFLDSKTSSNSKAQQVAIDFGVPVQSRHFFLDNNLTESYITRQFNQLVQFSKKHDTAIAIAHPHPETIAVLKKLIPTLESLQVKLVPLSHLYAESPDKEIAKVN